MLPRITYHGPTHHTWKLRYYLRTKAAADAIKFTVEVGAWKLFGLKASFFCFLWAFEAWGSEVPQCSGDLYDILCGRCKNWRLKRQQSRWVAKHCGDVIFWCNGWSCWRWNHKMQSFFQTLDLSGLEIRSSQVFLRGMQCLSAWVLSIRSDHFPRLFVASSIGMMAEVNDAHHLVGIGWNPPRDLGGGTWGGNSVYCDSLPMVNPGRFFGPAVVVSESFPFFGGNLWVILESWRLLPMKPDLWLGFWEHTQTARFFLGIHDASISYRSWKQLQNGLLLVLRVTDRVMKSLAARKLVFLGDDCVIVKTSGV